MTDVDERLRELFEHKAAEVPPHGAVPRSLRPRARRRIALNAVVAVAAVVALGGGTVGALATLERATRDIPEATSKTSAPSPETSTTTTSAASCTMGQLRADAVLEGAMGSRDGAILLTNYSDTKCSLRGRPTITLLTAKHKVVSDVDVVPVPPAWKVNAEPRPDGWPVVTLRPGAAASVRLAWSNWCGAGAPLWQIAVPAGGTGEVYGMDGTDPPPCNGPGLPTTIQVGPFEPER